MNKYRYLGNQYVCFPWEMFPKASKDVVAFIAEGNSFMNFGIVDGAMVFVDRGIEYGPGKLSCWEKIAETEGPQYRLSFQPVDGYSYYGKLILVTNNCED